MNTDAGRERIDKGTRPRGTLHQPTAPAKPGQAGGEACSVSQESAEQSKPQETDLSHRSEVKSREVVRGRATSGTWVGRLRYYGLALSLVAMGTILRIALTRWTGPGIPTYVTFSAFVMLAALIGGWGPGLLATLATAAVVDYWLLPPPGSFKIDSSADAVGLAFFCVTSILVTIVAELYRRTRNHLDELVAVRTTSLRRANEQLHQEVVEHGCAEDEKKKLVHDLRERIKELTALYRIMEIVQQPKPVHELLQEVVSLLPRAWQYPEITAARLSFDGQEYRTPGYAGSAWAQSARFSTCDDRAGSIEVVYLEKRPAEAEGPFLAEERSLIDSLARILEGFLNRRISEEALREWNAALESKVAGRTAELQHRAQQLQKLTLELTQAEERERRRIALILHEDLQQQIAGAKFHLNLVRNRAREERQRTDVDTVDAMLKEAVEKSRSLSRDLSPTVLHMNDLAETLQWLVGRVQAQQALTVHLDVRGEMALPSEASAIFLFRAAQEMLFNVVQHAGVRDASVRVRRRGRYVSLCIADQGRGFDPQELKETSGMGLFSIRERAELLGGRLRVKSAKGQGSRFSIVVPDGPPVAAPPPSGVNLPQPGAAGLPSGGALRVLLVDDHDVVRAGLAALLREVPGIELVGEAPDGREAINMTIDLEPDVVIMDVSMPRMSGDQATRQIKAHLPQTRVIALSMYDEAEKKQRMFEAGAEGYILKTASAEDLVAAIRGEGADSQG